MQVINFDNIEKRLDSQEWEDQEQSGNGNVLVEEAIPLLNNVAYMKNFQTNLSVGEVLDVLKKEIESFSEKAEDRGVRYETVKAAQYCLCTLIDEFAARYGWADQEWAAQSLLVSFHNETWGGENFFQLLDRIKKEPQRNLELLELMYYCLSIGYMGKYQVLNNGKVSVENIKREVEKILKKYRYGTIDNSLLIQNQSQKLLATHSRKIPLWVVAVVMGSILVVCYTYMNWDMNSRNSSVNARIQNIKPSLVNESGVKDRNLYLAPLLKNEIERNLIQVSESNTHSTITILGDNLFSSGSDKIEDNYLPVLARVGQALNHVKGEISILGYTDDQPIKSIMYPSNWHLSQGRADAVKKILIAYIEDESRVRSEGKADKDPIVPNTNAENRAKNRRVEITVTLEKDSRSLTDSSLVK